MEFLFYFFSVRLFVGSAWSFLFFIPATMANDLRLQRIFYQVNGSEWKNENVLPCDDNAEFKGPVNIDADCHELRVCREKVLGFTALLAQ